MIAFHQLPTSHFQRYPKITACRYQIEYSILTLIVEGFSCLLLLFLKSLRCLLLLFLKSLRCLLPLFQTAFFLHLLNCQTHIVMLLFPRDRQIGPRQLIEHTIQQRRRVKEQRVFPRPAQHLHVVLRSQKPRQRPKRRIQIPDLLLHQIDERHDVRGAVRHERTRRLCNDGVPPLTACVAYSTISFVI